MYESIAGYFLLFGSLTVVVVEGLIDVGIRGGE